MGTTFWAMCSPGDPSAILAFMRQSIAASAWTIINMPSNDPNTLDAQKRADTTPYCYGLAVTVGGFAGYPDEWTFAEYAPAGPCQ
jgi:hypothetical protein